MSCETPNQVWKLIRDMQNDFQRKATRALQNKIITDDDLARINSLFGNGQPPPSPIMSNGLVRRTAARTCFKGLVKLRQDNPDATFVWMTVHSADWETSDEDTTLDLYKVSSQVRRSASAISSNYIAFNETSAFANVGHPAGGKLLSPHVHLIAWGPDAERRHREITNSHAQRYATTFSGAPTIDTAIVGPDDIDLARLSGYMAKPASTCKTYYQSKDGTKRNLHDSIKGDRFIRYLRMAEINSFLLIGNVVFAGGDGAALRAAICKSVTAQVAVKTVSGQELIHRDAIPHFWAELMPRIGEERFRLPFIRTRK